MRNCRSVGLWLHLNEQLANAHGERGAWNLELGEKDKHGLDGERYSFVLGVFDQAAGIDHGSFHP